MRPNKSGLKLVHKGLLLISIPLISGMVLILAFESSMQAFMRLRHNSDRAIAVTEQVNKLTAVLFGVEEDVLDRQHFDRSKLDTLFANVQLGLDQLSVLAKKETIPADSAVSEVQNIRDQWSATKQLFANAAAAEQCRQSLRILESKLNRLAQRELDICLRNKIENKKLDQTAQQILAICVALNVVVCPLIALYFAQNLVRRVSILVDNSERFANGQPLIPAIEGSDEISRLDEVFRDMAARVQKADRARMDFFTMISHDLRTPLNSLQATLTLIGDGIYGKLSPEGVQRVKAAEESSDQLISMVSQLLDLEKMKSGKLDLEFRPVRLRKLLEGATSAVLGFAEFKNIKIESSDNDFCVLGDEKRLTQVAVNLLANAIKFSPEDSTVSIVVRDAENKQIEVRVSDKGRGVPPQSQALIFERFTQAERLDAGSGSGLGLAICKEIIDEHYGTIGVESANGNGSTFWFKLKKVDEPNRAFASG